MKDAGDRPRRCEGGAQIDAGGIEVAEGDLGTTGKKVVGVDRCWIVGDGYPTG
jgi:hypothetical protein